MGGPTLNDRAGVIYASPSAMHHPDGTMPKSPGDGYEYRSFILQSSANLTDKGFKRVKVEPNP